MLATAFILFTAAMALILFAGVSAVTQTAIPDVARRQQFKTRFVIGLLAWLAYITIMSLNGVYTSTTFPPKIPLLLVFPVFAFIAFFFISSKFRNIIDNTPAHWLVYFQSFRIVVELFLFTLCINNMVPKEATFEGYNFDILIGITAPIIGWLVYKKKTLGKTALILWNCCGFATLATVVFVFMTQAYAPQLWHKDSILNTGFGLFPYTYLAGFLMPTAIFMHVFSLVKARKMVA